MCESGRVLHHLSQTVGRREDCVLLVGYQAQGTLGRRLLDGERTVNIFGEPHTVNCKVRTMPGFSAHADWRELLAAARPLAGRCKQVFVVHGEDEPAEAYAGRLRNAGFASVYVPSKFDRIEMRLMRVPFTKMEGLGNDYIFVDAIPRRCRWRAAPSWPAAGPTATSASAPTA
jgi:metallo-beta-lactamase family protein